MHSGNKKIGAIVVLLLVIFLNVQPAFVPLAHAQIGSDATAASRLQGNATTDASNDIECHWTGDYSICLTNIVYIFTVGLMSSIAYVSAYFFNFAVHLSLQGPIYALDFISEGWTMMRDVANMAFIFVLISMAFTIMLRAETAKTLSALALVIVVALVVNFSFFMTRVVIDMGNITAIQFYNLIEAGPISQAAATPGQYTATVPAVAGSIQAVTNFVGLTNGSANSTKDLTASIMNALKIQNILNTKSFTDFYTSQTGIGGWVTIVITLSFIYIAIGIMLGILAGSFLFTGAKFIMRIVGLWFVIMASPLAFIAFAIEKKKEGKSSWYHMWQGSLIKYAFYPAIYLFMFFILTRFMADLGSGCANNIGADATGNSCFIDALFADLPSDPANTGFITKIAGSIANVGIRMGFIVAILYLALSIADMIVKQGSSYAQSFSSKVGGFVAGGAVGGAGRLLIGKGLGGLTGSQWLKDRSYDPRNMSLGLDRVPLVNKIPGIDKFSKNFGPGALLTNFEPKTEQIREINKGYLPVDFGKAAPSKNWSLNRGAAANDNEPPIPPSAAGASTSQRATNNDTASTPAHANSNTPLGRSDSSYALARVLKTELKLQGRSLKELTKKIDGRIGTTPSVVVQGGQVDQTSGRTEKQIREQLTTLNTSMKDLVRVATKNNNKAPPQITVQAVNDNTKGSPMQKAVPPAANDNTRPAANDNNAAAA